MILFLFFSASTWAQDQGNQLAENSNAPEIETIPRGYRDYQLGMAPEQVKEILKEDSWFNYRGEEDLSLLERPRASLIDAGGSLFISRGLFQFEEDSLSAIMLELNQETIDWFTVYTQLESRYGQPSDMSPQKAWWDDGETRLALERPLTIKYLDLGVFQTATAEEKDRKAWREQARQVFLDAF